MIGTPRFQLATAWMPSLVLPNEFARQRARGARFVLLLRGDGARLRGHLVEVPLLDVWQYDPGTNGGPGGFHGRFGAWKSHLRKPRRWMESAGQNLRAVGSGHWNLCVRVPGPGSDGRLCLCSSWRRNRREYGCLACVQRRIERGAADHSDDVDGRHAALARLVAAKILRRCTAPVGAILLGQQSWRGDGSGSRWISAHPKSGTGSCAPTHGVSERGDRWHRLFDWPRRVVGPFAQCNKIGRAHV